MPTELQTTQAVGADARIPVVITVDTEPDNVWADHLSCQLRNIEALPRLQELLNRYSARATLLLTYQVAFDDSAARTLCYLQKTHGAEIGAHLHPWDNPPFMPCGLDRRHHTFPHELPDDVFRSKLERLTDTIANRFGTPRSYRAGRYGFSASHVAVLESLGYVVDTSVTPLYSWRRTFGVPRSAGGCGGVDFRAAPLDPYRLGYEDVTRPGDANLVEIPVTIDATRALSDTARRGLARLPERCQSIIRRLTGVTLAWARPTGQPAGSSRRMLSVALARPCRVVNIMFHSSELIVGGSPSTATAGQVERVFLAIEEAIRLLTADPRTYFTTLSDVASSFCHNSPQADGIGVATPPVGTTVRVET